MSMEINGGYGRAAADYAERRNNGLRPEDAEEARKARYPQKAENSQKAESPQKAENPQGAGNLQKAEEKKTPARFAELRDEYVSSEKSGKKPTGLYRVEQDENGNRKIYFDDPNSRASKTEGKDQEKPEVCVGNTDRVEQEIRKLKEKKQQLEQQLQSASGDEKKVREVERKLAQVEQELSTKDNDTYRRQHTVFT